ncbi:MAG: MFS transporter [Candidatus Hodarchaeales archaeon]
MEKLREKLHYIPIILLWLETILFILVYGFDLLNMNPLTNIEKPFQSFGVFVLLITTGGASGTLFFTGFIIDRSPEKIKKLLVGSMAFNSLAMLLSVFSLSLNVLILPGIVLLGISLAVLAVASESYFIVTSNINNRGVQYSLAIFISMFLSLIITIMVETLGLDFRSPLLTLAIISIICSVIIYLGLDTSSLWINDPFPTPIGKIITRKPVRAYFLSHFFIYIMLGVSFMTISHFVDDTKLFWILVFMGDLLTVLLMGRLTDRIGRKSLIVLGIYVIVFSVLIVAITKIPIMYYLSAFILGISFSMMHPSIDNGVWADLSPLDSVGRYSAINIFSLLQGLGTGFIIGFLIEYSGKIDITAYILIALAAISMFPLFFVADSYDPLNVYLLLVSISGLLLFHYDFRKDESISQKDLTLVSGALSALDTIFESLDTKSKGGGLDLVRHGNVYVVQSKTSTLAGRVVHGTIFSNKMDPELQDKIAEFINRFCIRFGEELDSWTGMTSVFSSAVEVAEDVFGPLIPSKTK